jgi:hypothetical protein
VQRRYAKLPYRRFHGKFPSFFAAFVEALKPAPGLSLIFEVIETNGVPEE